MKLGVRPGGWERADLVLGEQKDSALTLASRLGGWILREQGKFRGGAGRWLSMPRDGTLGVAKFIPPDRDPQRRGLLVVTWESQLKPFGGTHDPHRPPKYQRPGPQPERHPQEQWETKGRDEERAGEESRPVHAGHSLSVRLPASHHQE